MDSDSDDLSSPPDDGPSLPSDSAIEKALRDTVIACYKSGDLDSLTLKRIRNAVSERLDLPEDFLKTDSRWKDKSKEIVNAEVSRQEAQSSQQASSPVAPKKRITPVKAPPATKPKKADKPKLVEKPKPAAKRKSTEAKAPAKKRQKTVTSDSEDDDALSSSPESVVDDNDSEGVVTKPPTPTTKTPPKPSVAVEDAPSDSDLSSLIDDPPPSKRQRKKGAASENPEKSTKAKAQKAKPPAKEISPQDEEVKRLQGWLVKCGIRKLWGKELASFSTPREKISHLKEMLSDAGMGGKYSEEKARQIKEERELKADLEDIVERERQWGQSDDEEAEGGGGGRPRRRLAKGLKELQMFADDQDSSE